MRTCPTCGGDLPATATLCLACSAALSPSPAAMERALAELRDVVKRRGEPPVDHARIRYGPWQVPRAGWWERLRGRDRPIGSTGQARQLLREGKIEDGRELLRRIARHAPKDLGARVLAARELLRPPAQRPESLAHVQALARLAPRAGEVHALTVLGVWTRSPEEAGKALVRALATPPVLTEGHALLLEARLCLCDFSFQARYRPAGSRIDTIVRNPALQGAALLNDRDHGGALERFEHGWQTAAEAPDTYQRLFGFVLAPELRDRMVLEFRFLCRLGMALIARDLGAHPVANKFYAELLETPRFEPHPWGRHLEALLAEPVKAY